MGSINLVTLLARIRANLQLSTSIVLSAATEVRSCSQSQHSENRTPNAASLEAKNKPCRHPPPAGTLSAILFCGKGRGFVTQPPPHTPSHVTKATIIRALDDNDCSIFNETQTTRIVFSPNLVDGACNNRVQG